MVRILFLAAITAFADPLFALAQEGVWRGNAPGPGNFTEEVVITKDGKG